MSQERPAELGRQTEWDGTHWAAPEGNPEGTFSRQHRRTDAFWDNTDGLSWGCSRLCKGTKAFLAAGRDSVIFRNNFSRIVQPRPQGLERSLSHHYGASGSRGKPLDSVPAPEKKIDRDCVFICICQCVSVSMCMSVCIYVYLYVYVCLWGVTQAATAVVVELCV